jgi:hypothetical protein
METPNTKKGFYNLFSAHAKPRKQQKNGILQGTKYERHSKITAGW